MPQAVIEILGVEILVDYDFNITHSGCGAHMGSLSYEGHPAEPAEFEIEVLELSKETATLEISPWLKDIITTHLSERDDINDIVQTADMERDDG